MRYTEVYIVVWIREEKRNMGELIDSIILEVFSNLYSFMNS